MTWSATWTALADKSLRDVVSYTGWNTILGALGNLQYLYERLGWAYAATNTAEQTMTGAAAADLVTISGLNISTASLVRITGNVRVNNGSSGAAYVGLKANSTVIVEASANGLLVGPAAASAYDGSFEFVLTPQRTNYLSGAMGRCNISDGSSDAAVSPGTMPNATITSIAIRGKSDGTRLLGVQDVRVEVLS